MWTKVNYGLMGYTDLGFMKDCEDVDLGNGNYMQFLAGVSQLPLKLPVSFCLPKACDDKVYFESITKTLVDKGNNLLTTLKTEIDFDNL